MEAPLNHEPSTTSIALDVYQNMVEQTTLPITLWKFDGGSAPIGLDTVRLVGMNRANRDLLKFNISDIEERKNKTLREVYPNTEDGTLEAVTRILQSRQSFVKKHPYADPNVPRGEYHVHWIYLGHDYFATLIENISQLDAIYSAANKSQQEFSFLSNISHEIRTPLNGIVGITSLLKDTLLTQEQAEYVETLDQSSSNLMLIVSDILDLSRLQSHKLVLTDEPFNLSDCVESALNMNISQAKKKGLDMNHYIDSSVPLRLIGDTQRLRQVLNNFLSNAVKFTHTGGIQLKVSAKHSFNDQVEYHFVVSDTGIGISKEDQQKLFIPFSQVDASRSRQYEGTGLGLAISKHLVSLMNGETWIESELDKGSHFHFTIVVKVPDMMIGRSGLPLDTQQAKECKVQMDAIRGKKVLAVDDKLINRQYLQKLLYQWDLRPSVFASAEEVLGAIEFGNESYDLALIDICMPKMDGEELAKAIHAIAPSMPLIALSSFGDRQDMSSPNHFKTFLSKPIHQDQLLQIIFQNLCPSLCSPNSGTHSQRGIFKDVASHKDANILVAEDIFISQKVMHHMLRKLGYRNYTIVENGHEAIEAARKQTFHLILMDIRMPKVDGIEASLKIREMLGERTPPIVALTALALTGEKERFMREGKMQDYLIKPIDIGSLNDMLEKWLKRPLSE